MAKEITSQLHNLNGETSSQATADAIQLTEALRIITEALAPFAGFVLGVEYCGIMEIGTALQ